MSAAIKHPFLLVSNTSGSSRKFTTAKTLDTVLFTTSISADRRDNEYFKLTESHAMTGLKCGFQSTAMRHE